jgi:hypothetical protein
MPKAPKDTGDTVTAILKPDAPFDVLAQGDEIRVDKFTPVEVPRSILEHRNAEWLLIS